MVTHDSSQRFGFALDQIASDQWKIFEELAGRFLTIEDPSFRITASPSGDLGRDAQLNFQFSTNNTIMAQFSIEKSWKNKIITSIQTIKTNFPDVKILLFLTNKEIGASGDSLVIESRDKYDIYLDIRDKNWFLMRQFLNDQYENYAEIFSGLIVDPIVRSRKLTRGALGSSASSNKLMADAFYYISLEAEDKTNDQNLTKLTFDGIIKSILKDTTNESRLSFKQIADATISLFPEHNPQEIREKTQSSLARLTKKSVRHWQKDNLYCLSEDGRREQGLRVAHAELVKIEIEKEIIQSFWSSFGRSIGLTHTINEQKVIEIIEKSMQSLAIERGLQFINAVCDGEMNPISNSDYVRYIAQHIGNIHISGIRKAELIAILIKTIARIFSCKSPQVQNYLRCLNESYVLLFLSRQTLDAQKVISEFFIAGEIWLDTNIILPAIAEQIQDDGDGQFSNLLMNASKNLISLYVTDGVVEELDRHFARCLACWRETPFKWKGDIPFLLQRYIESGAKYDEFSNWTDKFRGSTRGSDDLIEFIDEAWDIKVKNHTEFSGTLTDDQVEFISEEWNRAHIEFKSRYKYTDTITALRLAKHDTENFLGVLSRRKEQKPTLSHKTWWLTLDGSAFKIFNRLKSNYQGLSFVSPIISIDFLINYILLGPNRRFTIQDSLAIYPHFVEMAKSNYFSSEVFELSMRIRQQMAGFEERVIRRKVRDAIDLSKQGASAPKGPVRFLGRVEQILPGV